jgi:hypothetical protein
VQINWLQLLHSALQPIHLVVVVKRLRLLLLLLLSRLLKAIEPMSFFVLLNAWLLRTIAPDSPWLHRRRFNVLGSAIVAAVFFIADVHMPIDSGRRRRIEQRVGLYALADGGKARSRRWGWVEVGFRPQRWIVVLISAVAVIATSTPRCSAVHDRAIRLP